MTTTKFSFGHFIHNATSKSKHIEEFLETFKSEIDILPLDMSSSKKLMHLLKVDTPQKFLVFQNAFMEYFAEKLRKD